MFSKFKQKYTALSNLFGSCCQLSYILILLDEQKLIFKVDD